MAVVNPIKPGDEVRMRGVKPEVTGVVTRNDGHQFCVITSEGVTYNHTLQYANPIKTGRHFEVEKFLESIR